MTLVILKMFVSDLATQGSKGSHWSRVHITGFKKANRGYFEDVCLIKQGWGKVDKAIPGCPGRRPTLNICSSQFVPWRDKKVSSQYHWCLKSHKQPWAILVKLSVFMEETEWCSICGVPVLGHFESFFFTENCVVWVGLLLVINGDWPSWG